MSELYKELLESTEFIQSFAEGILDELADLRAIARDLDASKVVPSRHAKAGRLPNRAPRR